MGTHSEIARKIDGLSGLPEALQVKAITDIGRQQDALELGEKLNKLEVENLQVVLQEDAVKLADEMLDAGTLQTVLSIGRFDEAATLVKATDPDAIKLLGKFSEEGLKAFLRIDVGNADRLREGIVVATYKSPGFDEMTPQVAETFALSLRELETANVDNLKSVTDGGIVENIDSLKNGQYSNVKGSIYEIIVDAKELNPNKIEEVSSTGKLNNGQDISEELTVYGRNGEGKKTVTADDEYEIDAVTDGTQIVAEMKAGSVEKQDILEKLVRFRYYLIHEKNIPKNQLDGEMVFIFNSKSEPGLSDNVIDTIEANGGRVEYREVYD